MQVTRWFRGARTLAVTRVQGSASHSDPPCMTGRDAPAHALRMPCLAGPLSQKKVETKVTQARQPAPQDGPQAHLRGCRWARPIHAQPDIGQHQAGQRGQPQQRRRQALRGAGRAGAVRRACLSVGAGQQSKARTCRLRPAPCTARPPHPTPPACPTPGAARRGLHERAVQCWHVWLTSMTISSSRGSFNASSSISSQSLSTNRSSAARPAHSVGQPYP